MTIQLDSHLHGEIILQHGFPREYDSLTTVLDSVTIPLRPLGPFTTAGRPKEPKRHERRIGGVEKPFLLPVDQRELNKSIEVALRAENWTTQPVAAGELLGGGGLPRMWKGDFFRNDVFVEVEFGNVASMYRDFFKFQIANRARRGQVAVLVMATQKLAKFFDSGVTTYETALNDIPFLSIGIQMPICFIGIEPKSFEEIGAHYEAMRQLCEENGLDCHSFDAALGAEIPVESEPGSGSDAQEDPLSEPQ